MADLALMSWALWLLGHADTAIARMDAAIQRADAISHPHSQAYACYYACILHALRGEPADRARPCRALHHLVGGARIPAMAGLARAIRGICVTMLDPSPSALEEIRAALDEYRSAGYQLGITALYVLLCPALLLRHELRGCAGTDRAGPRDSQPQQRTDI